MGTQDTDPAAAGTATTGTQYALYVHVEHIDGVRIHNPDHIGEWLAAVGLTTRGARDGFLFEVCPLHSVPEECECVEDDFTTLKAVFTEIEW